MLREQTMKLRKKYDFWLVLAIVIYFANTIGWAIWFAMKAI